MRFALLGLALVAAPAWAADRDFCPDRPGLNTPACTIDKGRVSVEASLADWTLDRQGSDRTDTVLIGDTVARIGVSDTIEARIGWTSFGHERERGGGTTNGVGDVTLGFKVNLANPDGEKLSVALLPYVIVPVGKMPIGAGDWGGGVLLPVTYSIGDKVQLEATGEVEAAVDGDGSGRHLRYSGAGGLALDVTDTLTLTGEGQVERDDDPAGPETHVLAALSLAVKAGKRLQFDVLGATGLNHNTPDLRLAVGGAMLF